ncbi:hypothetical protein CP061683_1451B, partial [Chlamydia psittaci 06-1683]
CQSKDSQEISNVRSVLQNMV